MGAFTAQDLLVVGAFASTFRSSIGLTLQLAAEEFNASRAGVADALPPLLVELCDSNRDRAADGMQYLVRELGARAVVASLEDAALESAALVSDPGAGPLLLSPNGSASDLADLGDRAELVWYLGARYQDAAAAYPAVLQRALDAISARGVPVEQLRLASVIGGATEDRSLANAVQGSIRVGGNGADALLSAGRYRVFELREDSAAVRQTQLDQLANRAPDIVLVFASGEFPDAGAAPRASVLHDLEALVRPDWQPVYIFGPRNLEDATLRRLAAASDSFRARAIGIDWSAPLDAQIASEVAASFRARFPLGVDPEVNLHASFNVYDALYYVAYALAAAPPSRLGATAAAVREGLQRITQPDTEVVAVGPSSSGWASELLRSGGGFALRGTRGVASFDPQTHLRSATPRLYCWISGGELAEAASYRGDALMPSDADCAGQVLTRP